MPQITHTSWIASALCTAALIATASGTTSQKNCQVSPDLSHNSTCVVNYTSLLSLHCPQNVPGLASAVWMRPTGDVVCNGPVCEVNHNPSRYLDNEDSGWYFCRVPANYTYIDYYINVTVLAPPSIVCDYCLCDGHNHSCKQPSVSREVMEDIQLSVKYSGVGPFTVHWQFNGSALVCEKPHCSIKSMNREEIVTIPGPHNNISQDAGVYRAVVTNPYGQNSSLVIVVITCMPRFPPQSEGDKTVNLTEGRSSTLSLTTQSEEQMYLWLCFSADIHTSISDINFTTSCVKCEDMPGPCGALPIKPDWNIARDHYGTCVQDAELQVAVHIPKVTKKDEGKLVLTWSSDARSEGPQSHPQLTQTVVHVTEGSQDESGGYSTYVYVSIACGILLAVVVAVAIVFMIWAVERKKKRPPTRLPIQEPLVPPGPPLYGDYGSYQQRCPQSPVSSGSSVPETVILPPNSIDGEGDI